MSRKTWPLVGLVGCAAIAWVVWNQWPSYSAHRRLESIDWMRGAKPDDLRRTAHDALGSWHADPHDAFLVLMTHGDQTSVPFLRSALARQPEGNAAACTWSHGRDALSRATRR